MSFSKYILIYKSVNHGYHFDNIITFYKEPPTKNSSIYPPKIHALSILEAFHNDLFMPKYSLFLPAPNIIRFGSFGFYQFIAPNVLPYALLLLALGVLHV